ncbi:aminodeoxychorismate lyase [Pseudomonas oryzihabitans]|nr:aminodeoxychorismate lyase [Pseudomonas psychrotolerans]KTT63320.1 aminodeoxychorismate lyase [Pseudomonas psychrotolerans]
MRKARALLTALLAAGGLLLVLAGWRQHQALIQPLKVDGEQLFEVGKGATPSGSLLRLQKEGVLEGAFWLRQYWNFNLADQTLHSGEYRLTPGMTVQDLFTLWRKGEVVQYNLTLVEGWSFRQVRAALARQPKLEHDTEGLDDAALMKRLGLDGEYPEGRFFPDTYRYVKGQRESELLRQANQRLQAVLDQEWQERDPTVPYKDPYQALIMASLVEKETGVPEERDEIAGVFVRRLAAGMLLQTDPTVIYGMGERYTGRITRADLREPSPYNTYLNPGLPPTPIAMPGREAIHAALHPKDGDSLYFVARGDGSHVFSKDLEAHNQAVREFQLKRRADYRSSPAPQAPETKDTP